jgi:WD repeat-containing protein 42A
MNEESDSSSKNQSDQNEHIQITHANRRSVSEDLISIKSPTKQPETSLSPSIQIPSKPEPQMASRSSPIQLSSNEPSTSKIIHSISHLSSKTQKRQFEKIKQELLSESEPCDTFALSSASSKEPNQTAETSADLAEIEHKHLIESESKRQRSELVNAESIKCNLAMETEDLTTQKEPEYFQYLITNSNSTLIEPIVNTCINESGDNNIKTEEEALELNENEENPIHLNDSVFCNLMKTDESKLNNTGNDPSSFPESQTTNVESENSSNSTLVDLNASLSSPSELMESETATTSKNSLNIDNSKAPKSSLNNNVKKTKFKFDPNECHDWDRIHDTDYFKERSFNFNDLMNREFGFAGRFGHGNRKSVGCNSSSILQLQSPRHLVNKAISGFNFVRRMKMTQSLNYHDGCVNALNFNRIGTLLASGSDDYQVCIWDWARSKVLLTFDSGHKSNVFQVIFII